MPKDCMQVEPRAQAHQSEVAGKLCRVLAGLHTVALALLDVDSTGLLALAQTEA